MWHRPDNRTTELRSANAQKSSLILPFPQNQSIQAVNPSLRNLGLYKNMLNTRLKKRTLLLSMPSHHNALFLRKTSFNFSEHWTSLKS